MKNTHIAKPLNKLKEKKTRNGKNNIRKHLKS